MATTTNYGWTTPDDTALVKDGASAIRSLGTSVDTTTKNLNPSTTLGDIEYRSSTANTNTRLGIGSAGQVLTVAAGVPSWATPAGGGSGLTYVGGATFSASSAVNVNDVFSATYQNYVVYSTLSPSSGGVDFNIRLRVSGADASTSNYTTQRTYVDNATTTGNRYTVTEFSPFSLGSDGNFFRGDFFSPFESVKTGLQSNLSSNTGTTMVHASGSFSFNLTTSFTGFTFFPGSGTITGSIKVYGLANS